MIILITHYPHHCHFHIKSLTHKVRVFVGPGSAVIGEKGYCGQKPRGKGSRRSTLDQLSSGLQVHCSTSLRCPTALPSSAALRCLQKVLSYPRHSMQAQYIATVRYGRRKPLRVYMVPVRYTLYGNTFLFVQHLQYGTKTLFQLHLLQYCIHAL